MVQINYTGQFGNCMFQYVFARLLADYNKLNLATHGPLELECTPLTPYKESETKKGTITITDELYHQYRLANGSKLLHLDPAYDYIISGYFQDADLLNSHVSTIKGYFNINYPVTLIDKTLVMVRLGDFIHSGYNSEIIHYDWYKKVFDYVDIERVFTITSNNLNNVCSTKEQEEKYLQEIVSTDDVILPPREKMIDEFIEAMQYKQIVCSNSTWGWWASFLSNADKIFTFAKFGSFGTQEIKSHGIHINNLYNIRNVSHTIDSNFLNITQL